MHLLDGGAGFAVPLSAYSVGPWRWLYRAAFGLAAGASLALAHRARTAGPRRATALHAAVAAAALLVAATPSDGVPPSTPVESLHALGMLVWLGLLTADLAGRGGRWPERPRLAAPALRAATIALFLLAVAAKATASPIAGAVQRVLVAWLFAALLPRMLVHDRRRRSEPRFQRRRERRIANH